MMTSKICVAVSVLASVASYEAKADPQQDPKSLDILGFHLGMPADQVAAVAKNNVENAILRPHAGSLSMGTFTSPELLFSELISHQRDYRTGATTEQLETVNLIFGQQSGAGILAIDRYKPYSQDKAPTIKGLIEQIEDKYGKPTDIEENHSNTAGAYLLFYSYNASSPYNRYVPTAYDQCTSHMPGGGLADKLAIGGVSPEAQVPEFLSKCGTVMTFDIEPLPSNHDLAGLMLGRIADLKGLREANSYLLDMLKKGMQASAEADREKAAANKTKL